MEKHGFQDRKLAPCPDDVATPDPVVTVSWETGALVSSGLRALLYGFDDVGGIPACGQSQLQLSVAVTTDLDGDARAVVAASGEIDIASVGPLRAATLALASAAQQRPGVSVTLVLDWERVTFLDSSAVHLLQNIHAVGVERGWALELIPPAAPAPGRLLQFAADRGWFPDILTAALAAPVPGPSDRPLLAIGA
jgi:anti-anti-sigma regulatory factor